MSKVSVIIPTYNRKEVLRETIDSVIHQQFTDLDIIVTDDGSTDGTPAMVRSMNLPRLRCVEIPHSGLPAMARNAGIESSDSPYLAFLDSDDAWAPDKLARQIRALDENPDIGWSYTNAVSFGPDRPDKELIYAQWRIRSGRIFPQLLMGNFVPASALVVRRTCLDKIGIFDTAPTLRAGEDYELCLRLAFHFPVHAIAEPLTFIRIDGGGISRTRLFNPNPGLNALEFACQKLQIPFRVKNKAKGSFLLAAFRHAAQNDPEVASQWLQQSAQFDRSNPRTEWYRLVWGLTGPRGFHTWLSFESKLKLLLGGSACK